MDDIAKLAVSCLLLLCAACVPARAKEPFRAYCVKSEKVVFDELIWRARFVEGGIWVETVDESEAVINADICTFPRTETNDAR